MFQAYDPERFWIPPTEPDCLKWMKRQIGDSRLCRVLFVYRALETGAFFLAEWLSYRNLFAPLLEIGPGLSHFNEWTARRFLREIVNPPDPQEQVKAYAKAESDHTSELENFNARRIESKARQYRDYTDIKPRDDGSVLLHPSVLRG